jgi:hypothetical protein
MRITISSRNCSRSRSERNLPEKQSFMNLTDLCTAQTKVSRIEFTRLIISLHLTRVRLHAVRPTA